MGGGGRGETEGGKVGGRGRVRDRGWKGGWEREG